MKKLKVSDSELRMLLILLALGILAAAYFLGYNKLMTEAAALEQQNVTDRATKDTLESMVSRQAQVQEDTEALRQHIQEVIAKYPSDLTTEKAIYIVQNLENYSTASISNISFLMGTLIMNFTEGVEAGEEPPSGYYSSLSMNYTVTYEGFKRMIDFINAMEDRTTIPSISVTYDQVADMLTGVITVNMYYLTNTGKEYVMPPLGTFDKGVDSIFGAGYGLGIDQETEGGAEEGEGGEDVEATE